MSNPMEQFVVKPIIPIKVGDIDISFTNSSLFMVLAVVLSTLIFAFCLRRRSIIPSVSQSIPESIYGFIASLIKHRTGRTEIFLPDFYHFPVCRFRQRSRPVSLCFYLYVAPGSRRRLVRHCPVV